MAEASLLSVVVRASTGTATAQLASVERQFLSTAKAAKGMDVATASSARGVGTAASVMRSAGAGGALALAAGLFTSTKKAIEFDRAMRNVNSIAKLSETEFKSVSKAILAMAGPTAQAPVTLAKGMYDLVSSGFNAKQSLKIVESSAKAASAGLTTTEVATKGVAAVLNAYRMSASDAGYVSDVLFKTVDRGVLSFEDLVQNIGDGITVAANMGVSIEEVGAAISTLTKQGEQPSEAVTKIKNAMISFLHPSKEMKASLEDLGYENGESLIKAKGFQGALQALAGTTDGTKSALQKLFPEIRGMQAVFGLTGKNASEARKDVEALNRSSGATGKALEEQAKSTSYQWQKLKAEASSLATTVGNKVNPVVFHATRGWGEMASAINDALSTTDAEARADRIANRLARLSTTLRNVNAARMGAGKEMISPQQEGAVSSLIMAMKGIPQKKKMEILLSGDSAALAKMGALAARVKSVPDKKKLQAILSGDGTVAQKLARLRALVFGVPSSKKISVTADTSGALSGLAAVRSAIAGIPSNVSTAVNVTVNKHKGRAGGGRVTESMTLVGERGPELVSLPYGSYVYTASQSKQMMADAAGAGVDQMAGGGKKKKAAERKRKRLDKIERRAQAKLDTVDYLDHLGKLTDPQEIARLRKIGKTKGLRKRVKRDINTRIFDIQGEQTDRASRIADLMDQQRGVGKSDAEKAQIALETANRHLAEAGNDPLAVAEAQLEIAEANNALVEAQNQAMKALQQSIDENTKAIADHTKEIQKVSASNSFQFARAFQDIIDRQLAGNWGGVIAVQAQRPVTA